MSVYEELQKLKELARQDEGLRQKLLATKSGKNSLSSFCRVAESCGCALSAMDMIAEVEEYYAAMKRSTNGGGENSEMLSGWDRFYEAFLGELEDM